jgi:hypothetical protein
MKEWFAKLNENHLAVIFGILSIAAIALLVGFYPEIGIAPLESAGQRLVRLAIYTAYWPLAIFFLGGMDFNIIQEARKNGTSLLTLAAAIILGAALVLGK